MKMRSSLFRTPPGLPDGFFFRENFLTQSEEDRIAAEIAKLPFEPIVMHGVVSKRRAVGFGLGYSYLTKQLSWDKPVPKFLHPLRERLANYVGVKPGQFSEAFINEYPTGAAIGWHTDAPVYGLIAGITLLSPCIFRLRSLAKNEKGRHRIVSLSLPARSAYLMRDEARWDWQHGIPPAEDLRYSITLRTLN